MKKPTKIKNRREQERAVLRTSLRGWPGYRTRKGRSGYDPYDSDAETGHMLGVFVHHLFTGNIKIQNPIYLVLVGVLSVVGIIPFILGILDAFHGGSILAGGWIILGIGFLVGTALLINLVKNLLRMGGK